MFFSSDVTVCLSFKSMKCLCRDFDKTLTHICVTITRQHNETRFLWFSAAARRLHPMQESTRGSRSCNKGRSSFHRDTLKKEKKARLTEPSAHMRVTCSVRSFRCHPCKRKLSSGPVSETSRWMWIEDASVWRNTSYCVCFKRFG